LQSNQAHALVVFSGINAPSSIAFSLAPGHRLVFAGQDVVSAFKGINATCVIDKNVTIARRRPRRCRGASEKANEVAR